jgi:predicted anti-sigma-YlaC factor YlaD
VVAKGFGLVAMVGMLFIRESLIPIIAAGCLWVGCLIATFITGFLAAKQSSEKQERALFDKLSAKYAAKA